MTKDKAKVGRIDDTFKTSRSNVLSPHEGEQFSENCGLVVQHVPMI